MSGHRRCHLERVARVRVVVAATAVATLLPLLAAPAAASGTTPTPSPAAVSPSPTATPTPVPTPTPTPTVAPLPTPEPASVLPFDADVVATYQSQRSCDPAAKPGVEAYVRMVLQNYRVGRNGGIARGCGIGSTSEHKEGRAFDYMLSVNVPAEKAAGDSLTAWLTGPDDDGVRGGNARRLGIMYVIWNRRIWSSYAMTTGWRAYYGPSPHSDHIHTSFSWDGALKRTSWWSGRAVTAEDKGPCRVYAGQPAPVYTTRRFAACPTGLPAPPASQYGIVWPGQSGSAVKVAQAKLGLLADGVFGSTTRSTLMGWQRRKALPVTGVLDKPSWARLAPPPPPPPTPVVAAPVPGITLVPEVVLPATSLTPYKALVLRAGSRGLAVTALQRALRVKPDGVFGASTAMAVAAAQTRGSLRGTGVVDPATWVVIERQAHPLMGYRDTTVRRFSTGPAVLVLEKALKMPADTFFGPATQSAVTAAQAKAGLAQTGIVDSPTWAVIEAQAFPLGPVPVTKQAAARSTELTPVKTTTLRRGASGLVVAALQRSLGIKADGLFGPGTLATVKAFQKARRLPVTGVVDTRTWNAVEALAHPLLPYRTVVLRVGSRGKPVVALQKALRQRPDGVFGRPLLAEVTKAQARLRLRGTGIVTTPTWAGVEKLAYPLGVKRW